MPTSAVVLAATNSLKYLTSFLYMFTDICSGHFTVGSGDFTAALAAIPLNLF